MRTSLNDIREIEKYLSDLLPPEESVVFQARLLTNPILRWNTGIQAKIHEAVRLYHRRKLKEEIQAVHNRLFNHSAKTDFHLKMLRIFNR